MRIPSALSLRPPSFSAVVRSARPARTAGITPARRPVSAEMISTKARTRPSIVISSARGTWLASRLAPAARLPRATARPSAPPAVARTSASISSCWNTRPRPAPRAERIAISLRRSSARVKSRFPTLAQAMSSTSPTAADSISSVVRMSPTMSSWSGTTVAPQPALLCGYSRSSRVEMTVISESALAASTPGRSRATTLSL